MIRAFLHLGLELHRQRLDHLLIRLDLMLNRGGLGTKPALTDGLASLTRRPTVNPEEERNSPAFIDDFNGCPELPLFSSSIRHAPRLDWATF
jgi:hypothetical protein